MRGNLNWQQKVTNCWIFLFPNMPESFTEEQFKKIFSFIELHMHACQWNATEQLPKFKPYFHFNLSTSILGTLCKDKVSSSSCFWKAGVLESESKCHCWIPNNIKKLNRNNKFKSSSKSVIPLVTLWYTYTVAKLNLPGVTITRKGAHRHKQL